MSTFAFPVDANSDGELAANMDTFTDKSVAIRALSSDLVPISTQFGSNPALRVKVIDLDTGAVTSPHLLFWSRMQHQILDSPADWVVGRIENTPQQGDPTKSVYLLAVNPDLDLNTVRAHIAAADAAAVISA